MNLQQFKYIRETVKRNFNLTEAARAMFTSQPGVSKAIIELEDELGVKIFERHGKRVKGLTKPGVAVAQIVDRIMLEVENLKKVGDQYARVDEGSFVIACTHTQARYAMPQAIARFKQLFPKVHLSLIQGSPSQLADMVLQEQADLAIATEALSLTPGLVTLPCYTWEHVVIVARDHPLAKLSREEAAQLTLQDLAKHSIITYDPAFAGRKAIDRAFQDAGVAADVVLEAIDADVIKTYVELDMGIGIIAGVAYNPERDSRLAGLPVGHLFGMHTSRIGLKSGVFVRDYVYTFIELLAPSLDKQLVQEAVKSIETAE